MRPTFMGFETATRGIMLNQKALDIVGNNTTNIGVTGYTRQRVDMVSLNVNMRYSRYANNSVPFAGQGAAAYGVSQVRDPFLDKRFREEYSDVGLYSETSAVLEDLHSAMDEIDPSTMSVAMGKFRSSWNELLAKNSEVTNSANVLANAGQIVSIFRQMSAKIDNVWSQEEYNLQQDVQEVNTKLERIALLNDAISKEIFNSMEVGNENYQSLSLLDERNVLLDELSSFGDITYREMNDGTVTVEMAGHTVVEGDVAQQMNMATNPSVDGYPTVKLSWNNTGEEVNLTSGSMRGALDMLNGAGIHAESNMGETNERGIHYYKEKIDQFARTFAHAFNSAVQLADANGDAFNPPRYKALFTFENDGSESAASIKVSEEWDDHPEYLLEDVLDKIEEGSESNSFAAKVYNLFDSELDFGEFQGSIDDYITFYSVTKLSNDKEFADTRLDAVSSISDTISTQIMEISGVSLDEEGVEMMMYQKSYDAVSRVFTTLDEMLDKLINGTGVVGR